jgi:hypothetical protein
MITSTSSSPTPIKTRTTAHSIDKIRRSWRSFASSIVVTARAAEKAAARPSSSKELDDAVVTNVRARIEFRRYCSLMEGALRGQAKESEALEGMLRSQPNMGRKRKASSNGANELHSENANM